METTRGSLKVRAFDKDLEITSSRIRVRLFFRDGGYAQEFYAIDARGKFQLILTSLYKDLIPFSDFRTCSSPMIAGEKQHLFGVCRESLRMVYSSAEIVHHDEQSVEIKLSGSTQGHTLDCRMVLPANSNMLQVKVSDTFGQSGRPPLIEYVMNSFAFVPGGQSIGSTNELDFCWTPSLRPGNDCVIGDHSFHSPALVIQHGPEAAALIPDLGLLAEHRVMPAALDLDINNGLLFAPLLSYGFCGYERDAVDRCCRHDITMAKRLQDRRLIYGYHLLLDAKCKRNSAGQAVARFMWNKFGIPTLNAGKTTPKSNRFVAGTQAVVDMRTAYGLYDYGVESQDEHVVHSARSVKELVLSSPQHNGIFSTRYDTQRNEWNGCNNIAGDGFYNTVECSEQLYWLMKWNNELEQDPRIIPYCRNYADFLIESRLRTGAIPSWYTREMHPISTLRSSIQTAASVIFLTELARVTGLAKYRAAAERSATYVLNTLKSAPSYQDHTLIDHKRKCSIECGDPHSGTDPKSGQAILWAADMFLGLYKLTGHRKYLDMGTSTLDQLCLLQSVWNKPWESGHSFGMVAGNNLDAEYDPELTVDFARCILGYASITGSQEYAQRGEAAVRSVNGVISHRINAGIADIQRQFGSIYVHVGRKWAVCTDGVKIEDIEYQKGGVRLQVDNRDTASIVFSGMRGSNYKLIINDQQRILSREQMEAGVSVPANKGSSEDTITDEVRSTQPGLFD